MKKNALKLIIGLTIIFSVNLLSAEIDCSSGEECLKKGVSLKDSGQEEESFDFFEMSCSLGEGLGCANAGRVLYFKKELEKAKSFYEKGCELNEGNSCYFLGDLYKKEGDSKNEIRLYAKACKLKSADACYLMGNYFYQNDEPIQAYIFFKDSCTYGSKSGCKAYAMIDDAIFQASIDGCKNKDPEMCVVLAERYLNGDRVEKSVSNAILYFGKACELGDDTSCQKIKKMSVPILAMLKKLCDNKTEGACDKYENIKKSLDKEKN